MFSAKINGHFIVGHLHTSPSHCTATLPSIEFSRLVATVFDSLYISCISSTLLSPPSVDPLPAIGFGRYGVVSHARNHGLWPLLPLTWNFVMLPRLALSCQSLPLYQ